MNAVHLKTLGSRIQALRKERGMSLRALGDAVGLSHGYISQLERGEAENPSTQVLQKVADGLGVTASSLLGEESSPPSPPGQIPSSLAQFLEDARRRKAPIPECDVQMLLGIRYRGRRPNTVDDWALLYSVIKRTC